MRPMSFDQLMEIEANNLIIIARLDHLFAPTIERVTIAVKQMYDLSANIVTITLVSATVRKDM